MVEDEECILIEDGKTALAYLDSAVNTIIKEQKFEKLRVKLSQCSDTKARKSALMHLFNKYMQKFSFKHKGNLPSIFLDESMEQYFLYRIQCSANIDFGFDKEYNYFYDKMIISAFADEYDSIYEKVKKAKISPVQGTIPRPIKPNSNGLPYLS